MCAKRLLKAKIFVIMLMVAGSVMAGQMQKWVDENGNVHYGTNPPSDAKTRAVQTKVNSITGEVDTPRRPTAILYSTSWCGYCKRARAFMKHNGIAYREYDIESDPIARTKYNRLGYSQVPVIVYGDDVLAGFTASSYSALFAN